MEKKQCDDLELMSEGGGLKEPVLRWFNETQAPVIQHNGDFPGWFQGFAARKDAEDLLRDKALGCFLIRLSQKNIGYILSYKGQDRCRHFIITQNQDGLFAVTGDCQTHRSIAELIEHYKVVPIQPFGERLTSSCQEIDIQEVYDVVKFEAREKSGLSVHALRRLWDQQTAGNADLGGNQRDSQQIQPSKVQPPALPSKSKPRRLRGAMSVGETPHSWVVPPLPKKGVPLCHSVSDNNIHSPYDTEAQRETKVAEGAREKVLDRDGESLSCVQSNTVHGDDVSASSEQQVLYFTLKEKETKMYNNKEEETCEWLSSPPATYTQLERLCCQTFSLHEPMASVQGKSGTQQDQTSIHRASTANPLYQPAPDYSSVQYEDNTYSEVPREPMPPSHVADDAYERVPAEGTEMQGNTYETVEYIKEKKSKSTWGKSNMKWRIFLPEKNKK